MQGSYLIIMLPDVAVTSLIKTLAGVTQATVKTVAGVTNANAKKVIGITNV